MAQFTRMSTSSKELSGSEDGSHIFEVDTYKKIFYSIRLLLFQSEIVLLVRQAIGLLIGMEDVPLEKQSDYLSALLTPLCHQVAYSTICFF